MTYVALLRGIGPGNPNMRGEKLKEFFEGLGFTNVKTVISSGNVIFDSPSKDESALEAKIEEELPKKLGFSRDAIVRSREDLQELVKKDPFKGMTHQHNGEKYLIVTFSKDRNKLPGGFLCTALDRKAEKTTDIMRQLEKDYGKHITTRTWDTIGRILAKMG